ncbi:hypothetical protein [Ruegeria conchae]|uniref:hypothetical protein n=1 Tax=Ruegeria conchae TaxID=981384 RepID=UPI0002E0F3FF|nr:hypothetical protein [Ruegeria conchae]
MLDIFVILFAFERLRRPCWTHRTGGHSVVLTFASRPVAFAPPAVPGAIPTLTLIP